MPAFVSWSVLADVADHLQISEDTALRWITKPGSRAHRFGQVWGFKLIDVDAWKRTGRSIAASERLTSVTRDVQRA